MIRQAISCDICAAEKRQTNHWFVAYEQNGELRVSGWTSRHRLRPDSKHLCGQTCLHKLVDEFIAKSVAQRAQRGGEAAEAEIELPVPNDTSLTNANLAGSVRASAVAARAAEVRAAEARAAEIRAAEAHAEVAEEVESSARLIPPSEPASPKPLYRSPTEVVTMPSRPHSKEVSPLAADTLRYASRRWHAEAWERERERELRASENHADINTRRRTSA